MIIDNNIKTTEEYFKLSSDELLEVKEDGFTKEECKLFDEGLEIVFFDSKEELNEEKEELNQYVESRRYEVRAILKTINERLAVILA